MGESRLHYIRNLDSLAPLSDHTDAIGVTEEGRVAIRRRIPAPVDEFGIPKPEIMVERLLGQMATENYVWTGKFDEHHLATPKADFSIIRTESEGDIGSAFRGLSCLKIDLPRQMHNFSHALFELPGRPSIEVMRQAVIEIGNAKQLQAIINQYFPEIIADTPDRAVRMGMLAVCDAMEGMQDAEVGMIPALNILSDMTPGQLRNEINSALRVRSFSDKKLTHPAIRVTRTHRERVVRPLKKAA